MFHFGSLAPVYHGAVPKQPESMGELLKQARARFNYATHNLLAEKSQLHRTDIAKLEGGHSKGRSERMRAGLARAFGVHIDDMTRYLDGEINLEALVLLSGRPGAPATDRVRAELIKRGFDPELVQNVVSALADDGLDPIQLAVRAREMLDTKSGTQLRMPRQSLKRTQQKG